MKGFKINLAPYMVEVTILKGACITCKKETEFESNFGVITCIDCKETPKNMKIELRRELAERPYKLIETIGNIVLHPNQKHNGFRQYTVAKLVEKIEKAEKEGYVILERSEYEDILKKSFDGFQGYSRNDTELLKRVFEPEEVELDEKKK